MNDPQINPATLNIIKEYSCSKFIGSPLTYIFVSLYDESYLISRVIPLLIGNEPSLNGANPADFPST